MKRIIITGKDSYIGNHIQKHLESFSGEYAVMQVDVISDEWKGVSFADADAVIHVAGIVHRPDLTDWSIFEKVNISLAKQIADKAKAEGAKQFVFLSTMAVYGKGKKLCENVIESASDVNPKGMYAKSKYAAEQHIKSTEDESFTVSVVRPPNVYGYGCKGGYIKGFSKIVSKSPVIPAAYEKSKQSVIYIDNLSELIRLLIDNKKAGVFTPQDEKSVSAVELMRAISKAQGKKVCFSKFLGFFVPFISFLPIVKKAYGGVEYSKNSSNVFDGKYVIVPFEEGIRRTVNGE